jgi:hypothetical protein
MESCSKVSWEAQLVASKSRYEIFESQIDSEMPSSIFADCSMMHVRDILAIYTQVM